MTEKNSDTGKVALPAFYGIKAGMTRIFDSTGNHIPVTVIKLIPNFISQVKTKEKDGHEAYQVAYNEKRERLISKPKKGHLKKASIDKSLSRFSEIEVEGAKIEDLGKELSLDLFTPSTYIDVSGISKGKGFQGVIKRFHFAGGPMAHGSHFHRRPGAIGNRATPARVFPNKKLPGHMGVVNQTIKNLEVVDVRPDQNLLFVRGAVPGGVNGLLLIYKAD